MSTYLNPYSLQGFHEAQDWTVVAKNGDDLVFQGVNYSGAQGTQGTRGLQGLQGTRGLQGLQGTRGLQGLQGNAGPTVQSDYTQTDTTALDYIKNAPIVRVYRNVSGQVGTSSPLSYSRWYLSDSSVTDYVDGMVVCLKVPVSGTQGGVVFSINSLARKPVVYNINSGIGTRYGVGSVVWAVYNSTQNAQVAENGSWTTITGCWQVMDTSETNTDSIGIDIREWNELRNAADVIYPKRLLFSSADNTLWVPANTTNSNDYTSVKNVNQRPINPFGRIVINGSVTYQQGSPVTEPAWSQYRSLIGYSFNLNGGTPSINLGDAMYVKCSPNDNGSAVICQTQPYTTSLPSSKDGYIYIELGKRANTDEHFGLSLNHPVYYHDGFGIRLWNGSEVGIDLVDLT